jgi:hypothetical protein
MSSNFYDLIASPERRRAQQLAYSVEMVGDIASQYDTSVDQGEYAFARCMLDAFYVHVRLLADFLVKATKGKDFGPFDFDVEWTTPTSQEATRLIDHWDAASKYVVHFGRPRVPEKLEDLEAFQVGGEHFHAMAADALTVFRQFLTALESGPPAWHAGGGDNGGHAWVSARQRADPGHRGRRVRRVARPVCRSTDGVGSGAGPALGAGLGPRRRNLGPSPAGRDAWAAATQFAYARPRRTSGRSAGPRRACRG